MIMYKNERIYTDKMWTLHLEAVIKSLPVKTFMQIRCESLHLETVMKSLPVKAVKTMRSLYFRGSWPK